MRFKQYYHEALKALGPIPSKNADQLTKLVGIGGDFDITVFWNGGFLSIDLAPRTNDRHGIQINPARKTIHLPTDYEYDPHDVSAIEELNKLGIFNSFQVITPNGITTLADLVAKIKRVAGSYQTWAHPKYDYRSAMKPFAIKVIKELHERTFYHATFKKYVSNIKRTGLQPSKVYADVEDELVASGQVKRGEGIPLGLFVQHGWSSALNPEKQRAVYMYLNKQKAESLAKYLAYRNYEDSVVIAIDGAGVSDYTKLVIDEDAIRDESSVSKRLKTNVPHFYVSAMSNLMSIGYKGTIPPQFISVASEFKAEDYGEKPEDRDF